MEAVKKLGEYLELMYFCEKPKRRIFSEADSAALALMVPILVVLSRGVFFPLFVIAASILLAVIIGEKPSRFLQSTLLFIPLFSLAIAVPRALLQPSFGFYGAAVFSLRVWAALSLPSLLTRSYGVPYIARGLQKIGMPGEIAYLITVTSIDTITAARITSASALALISRGTPCIGLRELGYFIGYQLIRGYERGERVNAAFISRGGDGYHLGETRFTRNSLVFALIFVLAFILSFCTSR